MTNTVTLRTDHLGSDKPYVVGHQYVVILLGIEQVLLLLPLVKQLLLLIVVKHIQEAQVVI
jgi:hypothetical protein